MYDSLAAVSCPAHHFAWLMNARPGSTTRRSIGRRRRLHNQLRQRCAAAQIPAQASRKSEGVAAKRLRKARLK